VQLILQHPQGHLQLQELNLYYKHCLAVEEIMVVHFANSAFADFVEKVVV